MKNKLYLFLFVFFPMLVLAQARQLVQGRVVSDDIGVDDLLIINNTAETETRTDSYGNFSIKAKTGDLLVLSSHKIEEKKIRYTPDLVKNGVIIINVKMAVTELEEVVVYKNNKLTPEALGLVPEGQKQYTQAERKVFTATNGIDGIVNAITGRTKMLKKAAEYEKKSTLMEKIDYIYTEEEIMKEFKVPEEYVRGFIFYIVEDAEFAKAMKAKNNTMAKFLMKDLAVEYLLKLRDGK
ncbi:MAG: hypothetical protein EOO45_06920 [Flavobacterium sp.]|nr:MAG: hypothetical protein EOO45_06920 [Flavobacterium sp.]